MDIKRRLVSKFLTQFLLVFLVMLIIVYGVLLFLEIYKGSYPNRTEPNRLFKELETGATISGNTVTVNPDILRQIQDGRSWLQLLDPQGNEMYRFECPDVVPIHYAPGELVYYHQFPKSFGYQIYTWLDQRSGQSFTWIYGSYLQDMGTTFFAKGDRSVTINVMLIGFLAVVFMSLLYSFQLASPLLHMLSWVRNISENEYVEPTDRKGFPRSRHPSTRRLRRPYRIYREIIDALEHMTSTLRQSEEERTRLETTREEWIAGVSHDLKTPLASVKGYAKLIDADHYNWDKEELKRFIQVIDEKADHMEHLIEDLSLTFRLKNQALPLHREPQNIVKWVRRSVIDLIQNSNAKEQNVKFDCEEDVVILYPIDGKWFKRAIDNLLMNASLHNPAGTNISVSIESDRHSVIRYPGIYICIEDDGRGMEEETVRHLFDRYYRGTDTADPHGTGSGLGTAIARQLIEAHDGSITVSSTPNKGTTIKIEFPPKS